MRETCYARFERRCRISQIYRTKCYQRAVPANFHEPGVLRCLDLECDARFDAIRATWPRRSSLLRRSLSESGFPLCTIYPMIDYWRLCLLKTPKASKSLEF